MFDLLFAVSFLIPVDTELLCIDKGAVVSCAKIGMTKALKKEQEIEKFLASKR